MVEKPNIVSPLNISFAKSASKVNVQALKALIWKQLCNKRRNGGNEMEFVGEQEFGSLLLRVDELAQIENEKEKERGGNELGDISVAMCFISTLHLCNEKGLVLLQNNINELFIVRDE